MGRQKFIDGFRPVRREQPDPHQETFLFEESKLFGEMVSKTNIENNSPPISEDEEPEPQVAVGVFQPPFYLEDTEVTMPLPKQMSLHNPLLKRMINKIRFKVGNLSIASIIIFAMLTVVIVYVYLNPQFISQLLTRR